MILNYSLIVLIGLFSASVGYGNLLLKQKVENLELAVQARPPLAVVDFAGVVKNLPEGSTSAEINQLMLKINNATVKLKKAGYLILDKEQILHAPDDSYVPISVIQNTQIEDAQ